MSGGIFGSGDGVGVEVAESELWLGRRHRQSAARNGGCVRSWTKPMCSNMAFSPQPMTWLLTPLGKRW